VKRENFVDLIKGSIVWISCIHIASGFNMAPQAPQSSNTGAEPAVIIGKPDWVPDPNTTSRRGYTTALIDRAIPSNAAPEYRRRVTQHKELVQALFDDAAMEPNREQTFMTPANSKNRVYFMWDFCQRNLSFMLAAANPTLPRGQKSLWNDIMGRVQFAKFLILEEGQEVDEMFPNDPVRFSEDLKTLANSL
jgi:hypothetical protein